MRKRSGHWENVYEFSMDALICACCASGKEGMRMEDIVRVCFGPTDFANPRQAQVFTGGAGAGGKFPAWG